MEVIVTFFQERDDRPPPMYSRESRQEVFREAEGSAVGSYIRGGEGGRIWHRRGALEFRRFDEVRRDLGLARAARRPSRVVSFTILARTNKCSV